MTVFAQQKHIYLEWGRGTGKSTIIAWRMKELAYKMPRGKFFLVGETYTQILTRTLPSTIRGLELLGYFKDIHFFVGRKPPKNLKWLEPYEPPSSYDHCLYWHTGAVFDLISLDNKNSGRGLNTDGGIGDEAALLDYEMLFANALSTNRGNGRIFGAEPLHHSVLFASSTPLTQKGKWLIEMEEQAKISPEKIFYLRASSEFNRLNLGDEWFEENKRILPDIIYNAEILNIRPGKVENGFYASLNSSVHYYTSSNASYLDSIGYTFALDGEIDCRLDDDFIRDMPIDIAFDYGASINCMVCEQEVGDESRYINSFYVKSPELVTEVVKLFCKYYAHTNCHEVNYYYDHTAQGTDAGRSKSFAEIVVEAFIAEGWIVYQHYIGQAPGHDHKYKFWSAALKETDHRLPKFRFNSIRCKYLIMSMEGAGILQGKNGFEKDKRPERNKKLDQAETTHHSDAADTLAYGKYSNRLVGRGDWV